MFDFVTSNKRVVQVVLAIIILPFAFFGIDFYFRGGDESNRVAWIGDSAIGEQEFSRALRAAQDNLREQTRNNPQLAAYLASPEFKKSVLDDVIQRRLLLGYAAQMGMSVADSELQRVIADIAAFHDEQGRFSPSRYDQLLRAQGLTPAAFENQMRQEILLGRLQAVFSGSALVPGEVAGRLHRIREQERTLSQRVFTPAEYRSAVKVSPEEARKFYDENQAQFQIPERVRLEFVLLTPEAAAQNVNVTDEQLRELYQQKITDYQTPEERRASHILIPVSRDASEEERKKQRALAEDIRGQLAESPGRFAALAKKHSQDPGSAERGGDLGFVQRGFMVKEFEDAVFSMKPGEISQPVLTQYGFHIIRLDEIKPVKTTPFEQVRADLLDEARKAQVQRAYGEAAQVFGDMVYSEYDSLKPVAEALKLTIQKSDWVSKAGGASNPLLNNEKLFNAIFAPEAIDERRNTEAIEVQPNMLLSARVIEHAPPTALPFEDVSGDIVEHLAQQKAAEKAAEAGRAALERLKKGEKLDLKWSGPQSVTLQRRQGLHPEAAQAVFSAPVDALPAYVGAPVADGRYVIYRISDVRNVENLAAERVSATAGQIAQLAGQAQFANLVESLRRDAEVRINDRLLEGAQP